MLNSAALRSLLTMPECINHLLLVWESCRLMHGNHPPLASEDEWRFKVWQDELSLKLSITWTIHPINVADWWREQGDSLPPDLQAVCLETLLQHLDACYGGEEAECHSLGDVRLALGRRWWIARETFVDAAMPSLLEFHQPPERLPFPNLRRIEASQLVICEDEHLDDARRILFSKPLRIALCALTGDSQTFFQGTRVLRPSSLHGLYADAVRAPDTSTEELCPIYLQELRQVAEWAREKRVDVLCLPELCVCDQGRAILREALTAGDRDDMLLIVPGSFHDPLPPERQRSTPVLYRNRAPVWTLRAGKVGEVTHVEKFEPFQFRVPSGGGPPLKRAIEMARSKGCRSLKEDLSKATSTVLIQSPVGWWGIMICRDAVYSQHPALDALCVLADHLIVISMTEKGADSFRALGGKQTKLHLGSFYYVNAAQEAGKSEHPADEIHATWSLPTHQTGTGHYHALEYVTDSSNATSRATSIRVREKDGLYLLEIDHRGLI